MRKYPNHPPAMPGPDLLQKTGKVGSRVAAVLTPYQNILVAADESRHSVSPHQQIRRADDATDDRHYR